jgi:hypothetical protein
MTKVKIDDRAALERAYPPDAFAADSAENSAAANETVKGVRVLSAPDSAGEFSLERGARQVGEATSAVFLAPYRRGGNAGEPEGASFDPRAGYDAFLDSIVEAAQHFGYKPEDSPGRGDPRIRGLRQ